MRVQSLVAAAVATVALAGVASCGGSPHRAASAPTTTSPTSSSTTVVPTTRAIPTTPPTATPPSTLAPTTAPPITRPAPPIVLGAGVAIGDSVLEDVKLYASATLTSHDISINAAVGRQWSVGVGILSSLRAGGKLPPVVIVALGSNGRVSSAQFDQMMQACAGAQRVVFMTVTGPLIGNNPVITAGVARYPTAALADWHTLAAAHLDWFAPDHVHVGPAGAAALGNLLASVS